MIGKKISELRKDRGFTITELAERSGVAKSYLSNIERDINKNPSLNVLEKIASVLNIELPSLLNKRTSVAGEDSDLDKEWLQFVEDLKKSGLDKEQFEEVKMLVDFIKWQNRNEG